MGKFVTYTCECGYEKSLALGGGIFSNREDSFLPFYKEDQLRPYHAAKGSGNLDYFIFDNYPALCNICKELKQVAVLSIVFKDDTSLELPTNCSQCGNKVVLLQQPYICPKCGGEMNTQDSGFWD